MYWKQKLILASLSVSLWAQAPAADPAKVVATIAGRDITVAEIQQMLAKFSPQDIQMFQQDPQNILSQYFLFVHLAEEGEKANLLAKSPYKEQYEALRTQLLRNARLDDENNTFVVTSEAIDSYYQQHSAQYNQAKVKVIYIPYAGQPAAAGAGTGAAAMQAAAIEAFKAAQSKRPEADARKLADDIMTQLRGGADFAKLAEQYSEDAASKAAGGDFGVIKASSDYPAEFKNAILAMKPGEVGELRQPTAFYVIRVEEKAPQLVNEVREPIVQALRNEHMNQWMRGMTASYQSVIKDADFFKTVVPAAQPSSLTIAPKQ